MDTGHRDRYHRTDRTDETPVGFQEILPRHVSRRPHGKRGRREDVAGIYDVKVTSTPGHLTDHYNPATKTVNLSESVYDSNSVAAAAVAAHECGHAVQHARDYAPLKMRSALVPIVSVASQWSLWVVLAGILLLHSFPALFWIGIAMIAASALFSIITLPVEYNASARAMNWLTGARILQGEQVAQAREALSWAARTYLVAALSAIATLIYYLGFARRE